jgi:hypothetical protein
MNEAAAANRIGDVSFELAAFGIRVTETKHTGAKNS